MSNSTRSGTWDPVWEDIFRNNRWGKYPPEHVIRFIATSFSAVNDRSKVQLLEIGCGPGANVWFMAREGFAVSGIDGSFTAIERAKERLTDEGLAADLRVGDFSQLPWPEATFDGVIENVSLYGNPIAAIDRALEEVHRVLKPEAPFLSSFFSSRSWGYGKGDMVERDGFVEVREGPLAHKGFCMFLDRERVSDVFRRFVDISVERISRTNNSSLNSWLLPAARVQPNHSRQLTMQETATEILFAKDPYDAKRWAELVEYSASSDVYYLPEYACATAEIEQTEPMAIIGGPSSNRFLAPLLIRRMSATVDNSKTEWLDAATPYGYGGLLNLSAAGHADATTIRMFLGQLYDWCWSHGIVSCVIRLHPLMEQQRWFQTNILGEGILQVHSQRLTYSIDCNDWDGESNLPNHMSHGRREDMRHATRSLHTTWTSGDDRNIEISLSIFHSLYKELLDYRAAVSFYKFPPSYFSGLAKLGKRMGVVIAWHGGEPVGANIAICGTRYAYGHLSCTNESGRKNGASTLLNIEEARWARRQGCELLYLGSGMRSGDGMEEYKKSFHGPSHFYHCFTYIADRERFEEIRKLQDVPWPYNLPPSGMNVNEQATK